MKLLTFVVPCYNMASSLKRCVDSLLPHGDAVEIIIIDDGSTDETRAIADAYAQSHAATIRAIHQPNGGHGACINRGLQEARGFFFKVVDADDWMDRQSTAGLLETIAAFTKGEAVPDVLVCGYARVRQRDGHVRTVRYQNTLPAGKLLGWREVGRIGQYQNLMMHALTYNTAFLKRCFRPLPGHSYYVDCLLSYQPLFHARTLYYLDTAPYQYLVGQPNQSVNKRKVIRNIDQLLSICDTMVKEYAAHYRAMPARQRQLLGKDVASIVSVASGHLAMDASPAARDKNRRLWAGLRAMDPFVYRTVHRHYVGIFSSMDHPAARLVITLTYHIGGKLFVIN